jgi:regulator of protease activity HflC (stomatin/prohibitin superfamily)
MMVSSEKREIITADSLNAVVDSNVYFRVSPLEDNVKKAVYGVNNYQVQIVALAKTTLRNIIGTMTLKEANSERNKINNALYQHLSKETVDWGIEIVRTELKEIQPPEDVQKTMNKVVIANNEKIAATDFATATETKADGERRAAIKMADGLKQSTILKAEGEAEAVRLVSEAANKYFVDNAQTLRKLQAVETSMQNGAKIVVPAGSSLVNVIGDLAGFDEK